MLVGCRGPGVDRETAAESLAELGRLLDTAGGREAAREHCEVRRPSPRTFIGRGSVERLRDTLDGLERPARCVIFDVDLTPGQQGNLEAALGVMVMDRTGLILDIFARRARTREGQLQVELAQYQYLLPRLRGMWTHLSRQGAGIGTRGPGETALEVDRRRIRQRISSLKARLEKVRATRELHRRARRRSQTPTVSLVGYTNAGKSTLLRALTDADVFIEDRLFATLDPTARQLRLPGGVEAVVIDTVGFIQRLPHQLVASFKATLEETLTADLLIHVIDCSHPRMVEQAAAAAEVLAEIGAADRPTLLAFNKVDRLPARGWVERLVEQHQPCVAISAVTGENLDELRRAMAAMLGRDRRVAAMRVPFARPDALHELRTRGEVLDEAIDGDAVRLTVRGDERLLGKWRVFAEGEGDEQ